MECVCVCVCVCVCQSSYLDMHGLYVCVGGSLCMSVSAHVCLSAVGVYRCTVNMHAYLEW